MLHMLTSGRLYISRCKWWLLTFKLMASVTSLVFWFLIHFFLIFFLCLLPSSTVSNTFPFRSLNSECRVENVFWCYVPSCSPNLTSWSFYFLLTFLTINSIIQNIKWLPQFISLTRERYIYVAFFILIFLLNNEGSAMFPLLIFSFI